MSSGHTDEHAPESTLKGLILRGIAVIALVAVLLLGAWGIIQIAFYLPGFITNLLSGRNPAAVVEAPPATPSSPAAPAPTPTPQPSPTPAPALKPATTYVPAARTSNLYGSPDLAVSVLSTQLIGSRYSVQFVVSNVGTNSLSAGWVLFAELPLYPAYTHTSPPQQKMYPGDKIIYTLVFDAQNYGYGAPSYQPCTTYPYCNTSPYPQYPQYNRTVRIVVDQYGQADTNKANNTATAQI